MIINITVSLLLLVTGVFGRITETRTYNEISSVKDDVKEDAELDTIGLLNKYGYPSQSHEVQTEDGYLLTMHRITNGKNTVQKENKPAVLLMHGLLSSSADWINAGPNTGLGYLLADEGFDVWMGNVRGNTYSRKHISMKPTNPMFWKYSWNEIGYYDLPAMIDFILKTTGQDKIHYAGHSQGSTSFFVLMSQRPNYNEKIKLMHALAPVAYMSHLKSPLMKYVAPFANTIELLTSLIGMNEFLPSSELMTIASELLCQDSSVLQPVCSNILFLLCGFNPELLNSTMLPVYLAHTPAGSSSRQFVHYAQEYNSAKFRKYDHGFIVNLVEYGQTTPPNYDLKLVTAPVALHYAENDWMSSPVDVTQLYHELSNAIGMFQVPHPKFNHLDYMWAINARELLYNHVVQLMKSFD